MGLHFSELTKLFSLVAGTFDPKPEGVNAPVISSILKISGTYWDGVSSTSGECLRRASFFLGSGFDSSVSNRSYSNQRHKAMI